MKIRTFLLTPLFICLFSTSGTISAAEKLLFDLPYGWNRVAIQTDNVRETMQYTPHGKTPSDSTVNLTKTVLFDSSDMSLSDVISKSLSPLSSQCENVEAQPLTIESQDGFASQAVFSHCGIADTNGESKAVMAIKGAQRLFLLEYNWQEEPFTDKDNARLETRKDKLTRSFQWAQVCDDSPGSDSCHTQRKKYLGHLRNESGRMPKIGVVGQSPTVEKL